MDDIHHSFHKTELMFFDLDLLSGKQWGKGWKGRKEEKGWKGKVMELFKVKSALEADLH